LAAKGQNFADRPHLEKNSQEMCIEEAAICDNYSRQLFADISACHIAVAKPLSAPCMGLLCQGISQGRASFSFLGFLI
jgi:hypothetical protein